MVKLPKNLGMLLLGAWLVATGLLVLSKAIIPNSTELLAALAVAAGIVILLQNWK